MQKFLQKTCAKLMLVLLAACSGNAHGQDIMKLKHKYYTSYYSASRHLPVLVTYTLKKKMINCSRQVKGSSKLQADPLAPEATDIDGQYKGFGYELAMPMSAENNCCNEMGFEEAHYYSNVLPMTPGLQKGMWGFLEQKEQAKAKKYGKIKVFTGTTGRTWLIGNDKSIVIPEYCWKVIYVPSTGEYFCYRFKDEVPAMGNNDKLSNYKVDISTIEAMANVRFSAGSVSADYISANN